MGNKVTLTFAADSKAAEQGISSLEKATGAMGRSMSQALDSGTQGLTRAQERIGGVGEGFDTLDTRAMGFRDTLTGVQDGAAGIKAAASGEWGFETLLLLGTGIGDLASGVFNLVAPLAASAAGMGTHAAAAGTDAAATGAATTAQWGLNAAFLASPITWIIVGIVALIAAIVLIATKTTWFQDAWRASWNGIKAGFTATKDAIGSGVDWVGGKLTGLKNGFTGIPGALRSAWSGISGIVSAPFKTGFNAISRAWNSTVGRLHWTVPDWVPKIGGNTVGAPKLPTFHSGGVVPGPAGADVLTILQAGERVTARGAASSGGGPVQLVIRGDGTPISEAILAIIRMAINDRGGDVQRVLGAS